MRQAHPGNKDLGKKLAFARWNFSIERFVPQRNMHRYVRTQIEDEKRFREFVGFTLGNDAWYRRCNGEVLATPEELTRMCQKLHLDTILGSPELSWQLLTDAFSIQDFTYRLSVEGWGKLRDVQRYYLSSNSNVFSRDDFTVPLCALGAGPLEIELDLSKESSHRGAAERASIERYAMQIPIKAWSKYRYKIFGTGVPNGSLILIEVTSRPDGSEPHAAMVAPSRLHPADFFSPGGFVPEVSAPDVPPYFTMDHAGYACDVIAILTERPLKNIPERAQNRDFMDLAPKDILLLADQLHQRVTAKSPIWRGLLSLRVEP